MHENDISAEQDVAAIVARIFYSLTVVGQSCCVMGAAIDVSYSVQPILRFKPYFLEVVSIYESFQRNIPNENAL